MATAPSELTPSKAGREVVVLGVVSFLTDLSSEAIFAVLPLFRTSVLGASALVLGVIKGLADFAASSLDLASGFASHGHWRLRIDDRRCLSGGLSRGGTALERTWSGGGLRHQWRSRFRWAGTCWRDPGLAFSNRAYTGWARWARRQLGRTRRQARRSLLGLRSDSGGFVLAALLWVSPLPV